MNKKQKMTQVTKKIMATILSLCIGILTMTCVPVMKANAAPGVYGIDVSKWQGTINWPAVAQNGNLSFAFIRVGTTRKGIDPTFYYNMLSAQAVGLKTGVYIYSYATTVEEAAMEAQFVLSAIQNLKVSYPIVWDVEDKVQSGLSRETLSMMANTFCAIIESEGYYPMVYSSANWYNKKIGPVFYDKWVAQWASKCEIPDASVWQYSCTGNVNGIAGNVDLNVSFKDYSSFIIDTGWSQRNGFMYYYNGYKMQRGWLDLGIAKYFLDPYGRMVTGWMPTEDGVYFFGADGIMSVGFTPIGNGMYFFNTDGKMLTGLQNIGGLTYFFAADGVMYTGFLDLPDGKHFFSNEGHMLTGLQNIGGKTYYFDEKGIMAVGEKNLGGLQYLFDATGAMYTGWLSDGVTTKYYEQDGHLATGLTMIDQNIYFFDNNGIMQTGVIEIDGLPFLFDVDGKLIQ